MQFQRKTNQKELETKPIKWGHNHTEVTREPSLSAKLVTNFATK